MNAGNMGIPLALFAFGQEGMQRATLMFVMITFMQYSLGIYILNGRGNWMEIFRLPLIYAAIAGLAVNLGQIKIPELLLQPIIMLGQATIPDHADQSGLSAASSGVAPVGTRARWRTRPDRGRLYRCQHRGDAWSEPKVSTARSCCSTARFPPPLSTSFLTEKYRQDPGLAASIVVLSTFISVFTTPCVLVYFDYILCSESATPTIIRHSAVDTQKSCWCFSAPIPQRLLQAIPAGARGVACVQTCA